MATPSLDLVMLGILVTFPIVLTSKLLPAAWKRATIGPGVPFLMFPGVMVSNQTTEISVFLSIDRVDLLHITLSDRRHGTLIACDLPLLRMSNAVIQRCHLGGPLSRQTRIESLQDPAFYGCLNVLGTAFA